MRTASLAAAVLLLAGCRSLPSRPTEQAASETERAETGPTSGLQRLSRLLTELRLGEDEPSREQELFKDEEGGGGQVRRALDAYLNGDDPRAVELARAALEADPANEPRRELLAALLQRTQADPSSPSPEATPAEQPEPIRPTELQRLSRLLAELGLGENDPVREEELFRDETRGGGWIRGALDAYLRRDALRAVLLAQAGVGEEPGNETRRALLAALCRRTGVAADPEGLLPLPGLVQHELRAAETAFFEQRYGASAQHSRRALLVDPENPQAWQRLGSAQYALGEKAEARSAWLRALELDPFDKRLKAFLEEKGWTK